MKRILIVEDSPTQAARLRIILEAKDFETEVAVDADAALRSLAATRFDMVISDIVMPGMSGYDLCRKIKSDPAWKTIPVILLTTRKDPMDIFHGLECGADNFYTKPYDAERLVERIRHIFSNRQLRFEGKLKVGIEVAFFGKTFLVDREREQILDLLISTFEDTVNANLELEESKRELTSAKAKIEEYARLLEGRVRTSEDLYSAIVEGVTNGIITIDERRLVSSFNPTAEKIFGYGAAEVIGQNVNMLMPEVSHNAHDGYVASYLRTGAGKILGKGPRDVEGQRKDGTVFPMQLGINAVTVAERRLFVGVVEDLTARRSIEQQLRQAQKMEAVGQLAGGIAHDFNNLLTVILSNLDLIKEAIPADERIERLVDAALRAGENSAKLTHKLLSFSRQQPLDIEVCDIAKLIAAMDEMFCRTLGRSIAITIAVPPGEWLTRVNEADFENALLNLAINSRDAMPSGGKLTIEVGQEFLDEDYVAKFPELKSGEYISVAVSDTGTGIPRHQLERVFEPFFTTKEVGKGTGLGLSMCYGFIKQSGGHISIYSEDRHGTTVRMFLPLLKDKPLTQANETGKFTKAVARTSPKILIVDDNDDVRQVGVETLIALNCRVIEARDAAQALALLEQHDDIDVLFTDLVMPGGINGIALAAEARKRRPKLRVLYGSGYAAAASVGSHGIGEGEAFIGKPYRKADLAEKLHRALTCRERA
jgi:PAS domain S-box-containing protein